MRYSTLPVLFNYFFLMKLFSSFYPESTYKWDLLLENVTIDEVVDIDDDCKDPQLCATIAPEIYKNLRTSEVRYYSSSLARMCYYVHELF